MQEKVEKYLRLLYPNYNSLTQIEAWYVSEGKFFIIENINEIDEKFKCMVSEIKRRGEEVDEQKIIKEIFDRLRADRYFGLLYPNYNSLTPTEQWYVYDEKTFIIENIDKIDKKFQDMRDAREYTGKEVDDQEIMRIIFNGVRTDKYLELLHLENSEELSGPEAYEAASDRQLISEHIDEIDKKFQDMITDAEINGKEFDKHEIIKIIVESFRVKELTKEEIGKVTINVPTAAKVEAEQVENGKNTRNNVKKGEKVGDDN